MQIWTKIVLSTTAKHEKFGWKEILSSSKLKAQVDFPGCPSSLSFVVVFLFDVVVDSHFFSSPEPKGSFPPNWNRVRLGNGDSNDGPHPFLGDINNKIGKISKSYRYFKIFFYRATGPISTKIDPKHFWVNGIQNCWNEGSCFLQRGVNRTTVKIHWQHYFSSVAQGQFLINLAESNLWKYEVKFVHMNSLPLFQVKMKRHWWHLKCSSSEPLGFFPANFDRIKAF